MPKSTRLAARISGPVDRRLRMLALIQGQTLNSVVDSLLDQALPRADELAALLANLGTDGDRQAVA